MLCFFFNILYTSRRNGCTTVRIGPDPIIFVDIAKLSRGHRPLSPQNLHLSDFFLKNHHVLTTDFCCSIALDWSTSTRLSTSATFEFQTSCFPRALACPCCSSVEVKASETRLVYHLMILSMRSRGLKSRTRSQSHTRSYSNLKSPNSEIADALNTLIRPLVR